MTNPMHGGAFESSRSKDLPTPEGAEDPVEEASEESFPASDSPAWNAGYEAGWAPSSPVEMDKSKQGCAVSFLMEERDELDKLCERTPEERYRA